MREKYIKPKSLSKLYILCLNIVCIFLVGASLSGCQVSISRSEEIKKSTTTMRIAAIFPYYNNQYWMEIEDGMKKGGEGLDVDIKFYYPSTNYNITQMIELIKQSTAAKVDAIVVQGTEDKEYIAALEIAREQGILIAFVDTDYESFSERLYVGTDNYKAGVFIGERLIEISSGKANVAILMGSSGFSNLDSRLLGFHDAIKKYSDIKISAVEYTQYDTITIMEKYYSVLRENKEIDTIVCLDGTGAMAFGSLIGPETERVKHILCFDLGMETENALKNGIIDGTVVQKQEKMGETAIVELYRRFTSKEDSSVSIYTDFFYVTAEDLEAPNEE